MTGQTHESRSVAVMLKRNGDGQRYMFALGRSIVVGSTWKRRKDGVIFEVVWMQDWRGPRIQVRRHGATNLKNTHWLDPENLLKLYERVADGQ